MIEPKYSKDFDGWNKAKKIVEESTREAPLYYHEREIWWSAMGVNIGYEIDGKHENYERPVLVLRKINDNQFFGLPLTSKIKSVSWAYELIRYPKQLDEGTAMIEGYVCLTQLKLMSSKRLLRKMSIVNGEDFLKVKTRIVLEILKEERKKSDPTALPVGPSEAEATNN